MNLKKKVGPLPLYGWIGAVALGVLIYYFRKNGTSNGSVAVSTPTAQLDPTQGTLPTPDGLSSGGLAPELGSASYPTIQQEVADVQGLYSILGINAPAPGEPQDSTTQGGTPYDPVGDTVKIIQQLTEAHLIGPMPATTGAATSKAQSHTKPVAVKDRVVAKDVKNSKTGKVYRVVVNPTGKPNGRYHVYGAGKSKKYVKVR